MIFTAAAAKKYTKKGVAIIKPLVSDESPFVARAAMKAQKMLLKTPTKT